MVTAYCDRNGEVIEARSGFPIAPEAQRCTSLLHDDTYHLPSRPPLRCRLPEGHPREHHSETGVTSWENVREPLA